MSAISHHSFILLTLKLILQNLCKLNYAYSHDSRWIQSGFFFFKENINLYS